ncbi:MAG: hypothetical protein ACRDNF_14685 [Streptosporangiaceae bacterium]
MSEGSGQGGGNICLKAATGWKNFADARDPDNPSKNCHGQDGALVSTHSTGCNTLWSGADATGEETFIYSDSYYSDLGDNHYPDGATLNGNIDSTYWDKTANCTP